MPLTKILSFMNEFKWLRDYIKEEQVNQVYVSRAEPELLVYRLQTVDSEDFSGDFSTENVEEVCFLNKDGELVIFQKEVTRLWRWFFGKSIYKTEDIPAIVRRGSIRDFVKDFWERADDVVYLLSYSSRNRAIIVYKLPQNVSFKLWIENEIVAGKEKLRQKIDAIG